MTIEIATIDGVDPDEAQKSILRSLDKMSFAQATLFSWTPPRIADSRVRFIQIPRLDYRGYSLWSLRELGRWVEADFVLTVQPDGFILDERKWTDEFLKYDYIGAPWAEPIQETGRRVGNSGFCLRSKQFCWVTSTLRPPYEGENDDYFVCKHGDEIERILWERFNRKGFAPVELAKRFSLEQDCGDGRTLSHVFGFHSRELLPEALKYHNK